MLIRHIGKICWQKWKNARQKLIFTVALLCKYIGKNGVSISRQFLSKGFKIHNHHHHPHLHHNHHQQQVNHHHGNKGRYQANFYCQCFKALQTFQMISWISANPLMLAERMMMVEKIKMMVMMIMMMAMVMMNWEDPDIDIG